MSSQASENSCRTCNQCFIPDFLSTDHHIPAEIIDLDLFYPFWGKLGLFFQIPVVCLWHELWTTNHEPWTIILALFGFVFRRPKPLKITKISINLYHYWINNILPILTLALFCKKSIRAQGHKCIKIPNSFCLITFAFHNIGFDWVCFYQVSNPFISSYPLIIIDLTLIWTLPKLGLFFQTYS